jgi:hypothetical protein
MSDRRRLILIFLVLIGSISLFASLNFVSHNCRIRYSFFPMPIWKSFSGMMRWKMIRMRGEAEISWKSRMPVASPSGVEGLDYLYTLGRNRGLFCPCRLNYWRRTSHIEELHNALIHRCDPIHGPPRLKLSYERSFGLKGGYKTPALDW